MSEVITLVKSEDYHLYLEQHLSVNDIRVYLVRLDFYCEMPETIGIVVETSEGYYYSNDIEKIPLDDYGRGTTPIGIEDVNLNDGYVKVSFELSYRWSCDCTTVTLQLRKAESFDTIKEIFDNTVDEMMDDVE